MKHNNEKDRDQLKTLSLDMMVDQNSVVRVLYLFVQWALDHDLGFKKENMHRQALFSSQDFTRYLHLWVSS